MTVNRASHCLKIARNRRRLYGVGLQTTNEFVTLHDCEQNVGLPTTFEFVTPHDCEQSVVLPEDCAESTKWSQLEKWEENGIGSSSGISVEFVASKKM